MSWTAQWKQVRRSGFIGALMAILLALGLLMFPPGRWQWLARLSYDLPFNILPRLVPAEVVIVYMDDRSEEALGQQHAMIWNRQIHAQLLERLEAYGVEAVAFDVGFEGTTTNDAAFLQAVKHLGKVVVATRDAGQNFGRIGVSEIREPFAALKEVALCGVAEVPEQDGVVREHYNRRQEQTSLASRTLQVSGAAQLPAASTVRNLNYYGPPGTIRSVSYIDVIRPPKSPLSLSNLVLALSNQVVFVGALNPRPTRPGVKFDVHSTPYGVKAPGVEINATAYANLARGDWLSRISPWSEFLLLVGGGIVFGFGLGFFRPVTVALLSAGAAALIFATACFFMWQQQVWFPWAALSLVQIPCAAACSVVARAQRWHREKMRLEEELVAARARPAPRPSALPISTPPGTTPTPEQQIRQQLARLANFPSALDSGTATVEGLSAPPLVPDHTLLCCIGAGAYGEVWLGTNVLGAYRAIKIVRRHRFEEDRPFEREFEGIKHFDPISRNHPGLVQLLHVGRNEPGGYFFYMMELADDASGNQPFSPDRYLAKTLAAELKARGRLQAEECVELGLTLTDTLDYLHGRGLIHRDIKPANIIFVDGKPKLADIGLVTEIGNAQSFVGTEGYYPPEGPGSPVGDTYSLGKVLYEALTGLHRRQFPELHADLETGATELVRGLNRIILRACNNHVKRRYATAHLMRTDLMKLTHKKTRWRDLFRRFPSNPPPHE